jgi:tetratricopeptide (TPR) repeat protein
MNKPTPDAAFMEVAALLERRRTAMAKERLKHFLQVYPDNPELLLLSGRAEYMDDNNEAALSIAQQVLAQDPENADARELLFDALKDEGRLPEAERIIIDLLKDYPEHAPFYGEYAMLMYQAMHLKKARALAEEGMKYDPDELNCMYVRLLCDFIDKRKNSETHSLQQLLARYPDAMQTMVSLVLVLVKRGRFRAALQVSQELLRAEPHNKDVLDIVLDLKAAAHWTMLPLWPLQRWGYVASFIIWLGGIVVFSIVVRYDEEAGGSLILALIVYVIYSWVWPPIVRRWIVK